MCPLPTTTPLVAERYTLFGFHSRTKREQNTKSRALWMMAWWARAVNGAMAGLSVQPAQSHAGSEIPLYSAGAREYEIRKQRHEPSRHNFPNHLILFKFPHALLALVDQNEAKRRAFPWLFYCTKSSVLHLRKRVGNWGFASLSQGYLKLEAILQFVLFPAFFHSSY